MIDLHDSMRTAWGLDPSVAFCNHGSFGACPSAVLAEQRRLQDLLEADPVHFFDRRLEGMLDAAREALAGFVAADPEGLVFVRNATTGVSVLLRALPIGEGDEILVTSHGYEACRLSALRVAGEAGASVRAAPIPGAVAGPEDVVEAVLGSVTGRTRAAVVDHVTSPTALVFPVEALVAGLTARGIEVIVDGAHGPGQVTVEAAGLGAAGYAGNCHKWMCAPKGAGFVWVRPDLRERVLPPATSHGEGHRRPGRSRLHDRFDWVGTEDPTPYLCVPAAIRSLEELVVGGWPAIRDRNHRLALAGRERLAGLGLEPSGPEEMVGAMAALRLPRTVPPGSARDEARRLAARLYDEHRVQAAVTWRRGSGDLMVRLSAHLHTSLEDVERLAAALAAVG
jgi:isopenicillin-N epimerase